MNKTVTENITGESHMTRHTQATLTHTHKHTQTRTHTQTYTGTEQLQLLERVTRTHRNQPQSCL